MDVPPLNYVYSRRAPDELRTHLRRRNVGDRIIFIRAQAINAGAAGRVQQTYEARRAQ